MEQVAGADIQDLGDKKDLAALGTHMVLPRPGIPTVLTLGTILGAPERDRIMLMAPGTTTEIAWGTLNSEEIWILKVVDGTHKVPSGAMVIHLEVGIPSAAVDMAVLETLSLKDDQVYMVAPTDLAEELVKIKVIVAQQASALA